MNKGTKIRTILVIATCLNTALLATDFAQFNNATVDLAYRIASVILNFIIVACATWFNNDFTEEACEGTGWTRQQKAINNGECVDIPAEAVAELDYLEDGDEDE